MMINGILAFQYFPVGIKQEINRLLKFIAAIILMGILCPIVGFVEYKLGLLLIGAFLVFRLVNLYIIARRQKYITIKGECTDITQYHPLFSRKSKKNIFFTIEIQEDGIKYTIDLPKKRFCFEQGMIISVYLTENTLLHPINGRWKITQHIAIDTENKI